MNSRKISKSNLSNRGSNNDLSAVRSNLQNKSKAVKNKLNKLPVVKPQSIGHFSLSYFIDINKARSDSYNKWYVPADHRFLLKPEKSIGNFYTIILS